MAPQPPVPGSEAPTLLRLRLTDVAYRGDALGRVADADSAEGGQVLFASYGIPGEEVEVRLERSRRGYLQGRVERVLTPSPHRVEPPCPYFGTCGGCQWQHISYPYQLELKQRVVQEELRRIGKLPETSVLPAHPAASPWGYRNHAGFSADREGGLGFITRGPRRFLRIEACLIVEPWINQALRLFQNFAPRLHQLAVRYGTLTGQWLIHPDLSSKDTKAEREPPLTTGQAFYEEELLGYRFRISAASFFQVNTATAEVMVRLIGERLGLTGQELLLDAYAGVGTFARIFAGRARRIIAVEESSAAVRDARHNLAGVGNVELIEGKVEEVLPQLRERPEAIILDPPRAGCHPRVLETLLGAPSPLIVYVSCDPATLARDLGVLCRGGYTLREVLPVDLFPQTYHIEAIATLQHHGSLP